MVAYPLWFAHADKKDIKPMGEWYPIPLLDGKSKKINLKKADIDKIMAAHGW